MISAGKREERETESCSNNGVVFCQVFKQIGTVIFNVSGNGEVGTEYGLLRGIYKK